MDEQQRVLRAGAAALACALTLRLLGGGLLGELVQWLRKPDTQSFLLYLETGRIYRQAPEEEPMIATQPSQETQPPSEPVLMLPTEPEDTPCFTASDAASVEIRYSCSYRPDIPSLMAQPLRWDLTGEAPTVLIIHTHTTESYTKGKNQDYQETSDFRTLDEDYNMISIGDRVAQLLTANGIRVIHDRELHDYPSYNGSYSHCRKAIQKYLEEYPSICLVLDLHRDASGDINNQMRTLATVNGQDSAQLMLVVGTSASGLQHPNWEENLALGLKLHAQLERIAPGITRPLTLRGQRFNQDLLPGGLLIEVGAAGNSHGEALLAAQVLAQAITDLAKGTE